MILITGGTGRLGRLLSHILSERGTKVRLVTRKASNATNLESEFVQVFEGDIRRESDMVVAMQGCDTVISAAHGFLGSRGEGPRQVDLDGNRNLIAAATSLGVEQFILLSVAGATADHPMELFRMKWEAESVLRESGVPWTIVRPTAFMETWAGLVGEPLIRTGKALVFGRGENPINFVSVYDVAQVVTETVGNPVALSHVFQIGGPEDLTMNEVAQVIKDVAGHQGAVRRIPRPAMRMTALIMRPFNPVLARQSAAGVAMDTIDMRFLPADASDTWVGKLRLADVVRRDYMPAE